MTERETENGNACLHALSCVRCQLKLKLKNTSPERSTPLDSNFNPEFSQSHHIEIQPVRFGSPEQRAYRDGNQPSQHDPPRPRYDPSEFSSGLEGDRILTSWASTRRSTV